MGARCSTRRSSCRRSAAASGNGRGRRAAGSRPSSAAAGPLSSGGSSSGRQGREPPLPGWAAGDRGDGPCDRYAEEDMADDDTSHCSSAYSTDASPPTGARVRTTSRHGEENQTYVDPPQSPIAMLLGGPPLSACAALLVSRVRNGKDETFWWRLSPEKLRKNLFPS